MPPAARKPRARTYDPARTRAAVTAQFQHVRDVVRDLAPVDLERPTRLGDWTVRELVGHAGMAVVSVSRGLERPEPAAQEVGLPGWAFTTAGYAEDIDADTREVAEAADLGARLEGIAARFAELAATVPGDRLFAARMGAMRLDDYLVTRCVELVVHTDDLASAIGREIPFDRQALAAATRLLADALAAKAPGGSVELRIPPFAVVQCVAGPRHTRGTPPNVVETDPLTWLRLATGRTSWATAVDEARVTASGERADLGGLLPVLA